MSVKIFFEIGHVAAVKSRPTAEGYTHDWELFVRGLDDNDISHFIDKVVFNLHESFPKPKRVFKEPPYLVKEAGYAGFILPVEIYFKNRDDPKKAVYNYDLDLTPVKNQREEYVFHNPSDEFRRKLLKGGGFMLSSGSGPSTNIGPNDYKSNRGSHGGGVGGGGTERSSSSGSSQDKKSKSKSSTVDDTKGQFVDLFGSPFPHKTGGSSKVSPDPKQQSSSSGSRKTSPPGGPGGGGTSSSSSSKGQSNQKASSDSRSLPNSSSSTAKESSKDKSSSSSSSKHKHSSPNKESKKSSNSISASGGGGMAEEKHSKDKKDKSHSKERDKSGKEKSTNNGSNLGPPAGNSTQSLSHSGAGGAVTASSASMKRPVASINSNTSGSVSNSTNINNPTVPTSGSSSLSIGSSSGMQSGGAKTSEGAAGPKRSGSEKEKKSSKKEKKSYEKEKERLVDSAASGQRKAERSGETKGSHPPSSSMSGPPGGFSKGDVPPGGSTKASSASSSGSKSHPANDVVQQAKDGGVRMSASSNSNSSVATGGYAKEKKIHGAVDPVPAKTSEQTVSASTGAAGSIPSTKGSDKSDKLDRDKDDARKHKHKKKDKSKDKEKDRATAGKEKKERKEKDKSVASGNGNKGATFSTPTREATNDAIPPKASKQQLGASDPPAKPTGHDRDKVHHPYGAGAGSRHQQQTVTKSTPPIAALIGEISGEDNSNDSDEPTGDGDSRAPSTIANEKDSEASNSSIADMLGTNSVAAGLQRPPSATSSNTTALSARDPVEKYHHHKSKKDKASSRAAPSSSSSSSASTALPPSPVVADTKDSGGSTAPALSNASSEPVKKRKRKNKDIDAPGERVAAKDTGATQTNSAVRDRRSISPPSPPAVSSGSSLMEPPAKVPKKDDAYSGAGSGKTSSADTADHTNNNIINNSIKQSVSSAGAGGDGSSGNSSYYGTGGSAPSGAGAVASGGTSSGTGSSSTTTTSLTGDYMSELKDLQHKIMTLQDNSELQRVVEMIAATGCYEITSATFDFDLCALDRLTVQRLQDFFATS